MLFAVRVPRACARRRSRHSSRRAAASLAIALCIASHIITSHHITSQHIITTQHGHAHAHAHKPCPCPCTCACSCPCTCPMPMHMPMSAHAASTVRMATPSEMIPKSQKQKPKSACQRDPNRHQTKLRPGTRPSKKKGSITNISKPAAYVGVAPLESACQRRCHEGTI